MATTGGPPATGIVTPEAVLLEFETAGVASRTIAELLDIGVQVGGLSILLMAVALVGGALGTDVGPVVIAVDGELISKPYVEITLNLLQRFGIAVQREGFARFTIAQGSRYQSPGQIHVEADASSLGFTHETFTSREGGLVQIESARSSPSAKAESTR